MGAAGLIEIKRRMKSIESTRKITKAMGLVATSKLRKVRNTLTDSNNYSNLTQEIMEEVVNALPYDYESIYIDRNKKGKKLYIVLTSDTGLCGGFNSSIINYFDELLLNDNSEREIVLVGKKGKSYLKKFKLQPDKVFENISEIPTDKEINDIYNYINNVYLTGEVSEVNIVYTEFKSHVRQEPTIDRLLPIKKEVEAESNSLIEPSRKDVFNTTIDVYIKSKIMKCLMSSRASEESSRRSAMDGATENADDMLKSLGIKFNRIRQSIITQEISEIVGGAEAQK